MNKPVPKSIIKQIQTILHHVEDAILVGLLALMIGMSVTQIILRNLFETGITWSDVLVRILVLWVGLVGAMVASRQGNHISIDLLDRHLPANAKRIVNFVAELFTAVICTIVVYYSLLFVQIEFHDGGLAFAQVPVWLCEAIIPIAFAVIALRYFILSFLKFKKIILPES